MLREQPSPEAVGEFGTCPQGRAARQPADVQLGHADAYACLTKVETFTRQAWQPSIRIELRPDATLPLVACDRDDLQNAILNILSNADDAMPNGGLDPRDRNCSRVRNCRTPHPGQWYRNDPRHDAARVRSVFRTGRPRPAYCEKFRRVLRGKYLSREYRWIGHDGDAAIARAR